MELFSKISELKCVWVPGPIIIGAGPSGLSAAACLKQKGVPYLILEKECCLASLWKLKTYDRLKLHLPKELCELPYMSFPQEFPTYPTKKQFGSYLEAYAKNFSVKPRFGEEVQWAEFDCTMGFWRVQTSKSEFMSRWVVVATGENAVPLVPDIAGLRDFGGRLLHTCEYKNGDEFKGSRVLVVGCGNSGMEVSLDLCNSGAEVSLVVRNKFHILPRELLGRSTIVLSMGLLQWFPVRLVDRILVLCSWLIIGDTRKVGIRRPETGPLQLKNTTRKTPVLDVGAMAKIKSGEIKPSQKLSALIVNHVSWKVVCDIKTFTSRGAEFMDGKVEIYDSVILATGYRSNVASWLKKESDFFSQGDYYSKNSLPNNWKGHNGLYSVGFTGQGLLGGSIDAQRVAEDIARQWNSETKHLHLQF